MKQAAFVFIFLALLHFTAWGEPVELDLPKCVRIAITRNQALQAASSTVRANEARIVQANAPTEPTVSLNYNLTRTLNPLGPQFSTSFGSFQASPYFLSTYQDGVSISQLLFDGQKTSSLVKQQRAITQASRADYNVTTQSVAYNAIAGFYQLAINRELVGVSQENLKDANDHLKLAEARYKAGVAPHSDIISARVPVATARLNLTQAEQGANTAEASLDRILAYDVTTPITLKSVVSLAYPIQEEQAYEIAMKNRYEIKRAQSLVDSAKAQLDAAHAEYMPVVKAVGSYGYTDYRNNIFPHNLGYDYGLQSTFALFEGNYQSGKVAEAKALFDKSLSDFDAAKQDVFLNVRQAYLAFQSAKESVSQAEAALASSIENLRAMEGEYKAGIVPILNLTDAEASHLQAETNQLSARLNYQIAVAQLLLAMGIDLEDLHAITQTL